jgi:hypothetical protein
MNQETVGGPHRRSKRGIGSAEIAGLISEEKISCCKSGRNASDYLVNLLGTGSLPDGLLKKPLQLLQSESGKETVEDISKPLVIDLFVGSFGWTNGFLSEGWRSIAFDLEHESYHGRVPEGAVKVLADVLDLNGAMFRNAAALVCSPPCQEFSYMAMPWSRAKAIAAEYRSGKRDVKKLTALFDACFRIQREAIEAAGHFIPMVVENVRGAQPWVGKARWNFGSYYLWGDVPALMPITMSRRMKSKISCSPRNFSDRVASTPEEAHARRTDKGNCARFTSRDCGIENGVKGFTPNGEPLGKNMLARKHGSKSNARKAASAQIARIPFVLASWIARVYKPKTTHEPNHL